MSGTLRATRPAQSAPAGVRRLSVQFWRSVEPRVLFQQMLDEENRRFVQMTMTALSPDPVWKDQILAQVAASRLELRTALAWLARETRPRTYLEIGVRRGFSMAVVAGRCPNVEIFGFDLWIRNYAGAENAGPRFVREELRQIGHRGPLHLISGDSHRMVPAFFGEASAPITDRIRIGKASRRRPAAFDLMTIDGDHSLLGAYQDLSDTLPRCAIGGVVVFDDIAPGGVPAAGLEAERGRDPHGWQDLRGVWRAAQVRFPNFCFFEYIDNPPGFGVAVRLK